MAGNSPEKVIEVHGTMRKVVCMSCGMTRADAEGAGPRARGRRRPAVPRLRRHPQERHHLLRPGAGARGDRRARCAPRSRPTCSSSIGTSLQVYPVAGVVPLAREAGAKIVIVNAEPTPFDDIADAVFRESISEVLPGLLGKV